MNDLAVVARNVGKRYTLGRARGKTLREALVEVATLKHLRARRAAESFWALREVDFEVKRGDVVGVIGRNGAGKSTLLKILSRITDLTTGTIDVTGRVGSLLEVGTGFHPELTGRENIFLNGAILGMKRAEIRRKFDEIIAFSEVERFLDTPIKHYSSGMHMRLAFAVAAHLEPEILLVDEVLAVGDASFQKKCLGKMNDVAQSGRTIFFVSHNIGAVRSLCSQALWLDHGKVRSFGASEDVTTAYMSDTALNPSGLISESQHLRGDQRARWHAARVQDVNGTEKPAFLVGEPIRVSLLYRCRQPMSCTFSISVTTADGVVALTSFSRDNGLPHQLGEEGQVEVELSGVSLLPGTYVVSAGIYTPGNLITDWVDSAVRFDVLPHFMDGRPFDHRAGILTTALSWKCSDPVGRELV